ncbi:hypothetical protein EHJ37_19655 [Vibrio parahaemolyticus]|nr:hypothetical protein [Vibrio parahaemolyticus]
MKLLKDAPSTYSKINFNINKKSHTVFFTTQSGYKKFIIGTAKQLDKKLREELGKDYMRILWEQRQSA